MVPGVQEVRQQHGVLRQLLPRPFPLHLSRTAQPLLHQRWSPRSAQQRTCPPTVLRPRQRRISPLTAPPSCQRKTSPLTVLRQDPQLAAQRKFLPPTVPRPQTPPPLTQRKSLLPPLRPQPQNQLATWKRMYLKEKRAKTLAGLLLTVVVKTHAPSLSASNSVTTQMHACFTSLTRRVDATCSQSAPNFADRATLE